MTGWLHDNASLLTILVVVLLLIDHDDSARYSDGGGDEGDTILYDVELFLNVY